MDTPVKERHMLVDLVDNINRTLAGEMSPREFASWFEDWYLDVYVKAETRTCQALVQELYEDIGFFEPCMALQEEHKSYFGVDTLFQKLNALLTRLV